MHLIDLALDFVLFFIFFYDIDERRRYTKKVDPLKAWVGPSIVKRRREDFMGWVGVEGICGCGPETAEGYKSRGRRWLE